MRGTVEKGGALGPVTVTARKMRAACPRGGGSVEVFVFPRRKASGLVVSPSTGERGEAGRASSRCTKRKRHPAGFTYAQIAQFFDRPQAEAAADFGISITTMKHICRQFGLDRWPYRRPRRAPATPVPAAQHAMQTGFRQEQGTTARRTQDRMKPASPVDPRLQALKSHDGDVECTPQICMWREAPAKDQAGPTHENSMQMKALATIPSACTETSAILPMPQPISCEAPVLPACHAIGRFRSDSVGQEIYDDCMWAELGALDRMDSAASLASIASTVDLAVSELSAASSLSHGREEYRLHVCPSSDQSSEPGSLDRRLPADCHKDRACADDEGNLDESLGWLVCWNADDALALACTGAGTAALNPC